MKQSSDLIVEHRSDLIVDDQYYFSVKDVARSRATSLDAKIEKYISSLEALCNSGIKQGAVAEAMDAFLEQARVLREGLTFIADDITRSAPDFVNQIDNADKNVY